MTQILEHPVDFRKRIRLTERRRWGIGLAISLMVAVLAFGVFLWFERNIVFQWVNVLLVWVSGLTYVSDLQQIRNRIVEDLLILKELRTGLSLLWGVISWPLLAVFSLLVIFRSTNQVPNQKSSI